MARILFLIIGLEKPSSKKRVLDSLDYLRSLGHTADAREIPRGLFGRLAMTGLARGYDLVVIQKKLFNGIQLPLLRAANANLVFDFDDAVMFHEVERGEPVTGRHFRRFADTVKACRGVVAGNSYLADFARAAGAEVAVLPTPVDTDAISPKADYGSGNGAVIGWIGTKGNVSHLKAIGKALARVMDEVPSATLRVVSDAAPDIGGVKVDFRPWDASAENADLAGFDIGVMPLADDIWTRGKGGFKLLQYMAAGVPAVASPVGINAEIISHGENGLLASGEDEWVAALVSLARDPALRRRLGEAGRRTARERYSLGAYNRALAGFLERFV